MDKELIIECIALLNTANFQYTLNIKRDEIVNKLKEQLLIQRVSQRSETLIDIHGYHGDLNGSCLTCGLPEGCHEL